MDIFGDLDFADAVLAHHHQDIQRKTIDVAQYRQNKTNKDQCKVKSTGAFTICHKSRNVRLKSQMVSLFQ